MNQNYFVRWSSVSCPYTTAMHVQETKQRVIGYLRVSTQDQAESGLGMEAQRSDISAVAGHKGWDVTWHRDDGYTGSNLDRPALTAALLALRNGEADALVVSKLDRVSRSLVDFAGLLERSRLEGWAFVALDLNVDASTPTGELLANIMISVAQWERRTIGQRTSDALRALQAQGVVLGRPRVVSPTTAQTIGRWRRAGASWAAIAGALNDQGVPTAHGGKKWHASTVRQVHESRQRVPA